MNSVIVENDRYTVDTLYQWDKNQVLEIVGLSLASIPEIHFTTEAMDRAIVRQATKDDAGVITVDVPNSLLQKPYTIKVYVCVYEGETVKTKYAINIPIKARKKPGDYTIENDNEVYSFNALENKLDNTLVVLNSRYEDVDTKYNEVNDKYNEALELVSDSETKLNIAITNAEQAKNAYDSATENYNNASEKINTFLEENDDTLATIQSKANKASITENILSVSGWNNNTYSFETVYPFATYDIEIALNSTATMAQAEAFNFAQLVGSATSNIITAFGDVPTVDIPIIVKAVKK